jgi:hypothetical protein
MCSGSFGKIRIPLIRAGAYFSVGETMAPGNGKGMLTWAYEDGTLESTNATSVTEAINLFKNALYISILIAVNQPWQVYTINISKIKHRGHRRENVFLKCCN